MKGILFVYIGTALLLAGCTLPGKRDPGVQTYTLSLEIPDRQLDGDGPVIEVEPPGTHPGFGSTGMAYREQPYQLAYFAFSEWAAPPPQMLQPLLVRALESAGVFSAVLEGPDRIPADLRLETELLSLVQDFTREPSHMEVGLRARVIDLSSNRVLDTRTFSLSQPAPMEGPYGGVIAANTALQQLLPQLVAFVVQSRWAIEAPAKVPARLSAHQAPEDRPRSQSNQRLIAASQESS